MHKTPLCLAGERAPEPALARKLEDHRSKFPQCFFSVATSCSIWDNRDLIDAAFS
jgi:hypothetical protein